MRYLPIFGVSLLLTLVIECIVSLFFGMRERKKIMLVVLVNILTNPFVNFLNLCGGLFQWWNRFCQLPLEIVAIVVEAWIYYYFSNKEEWKIEHPVWLAVCANIISYSIGCIINALVVL